MKKGFSAVLLLLFIAVTAAYGQTYTTNSTITSGTFTQGVIAEVSNPASEAIGVYLNNSTALIDFQGNTDITVVGTPAKGLHIDTNGGNILFSNPAATATINVTSNGYNGYGIDCYGVYNEGGNGSSVTFKGTANITAVGTATSTQSIVGVFSNFGSNIFFDSDSFITSTQNGTGENVGVYTHTGSNNITFNGISDIKVDNATISGIIYGVYIPNNGGKVSFGAGATIEVTNNSIIADRTYGVLSLHNAEVSFGSGSAIEVVTNNGTGIIMCVRATTGSVIFTDTADITAVSTGISAGGIYGVYAAFDSDISFGSGSSSVNITQNGTGYVYGICSTAGSDITFTGAVDVTIENATTSTGDIYGVYSGDASISLGSGSSVKITGKGTGDIYGVYIE